MGALRAIWSVLTNPWLLVAFGAVGLVGFYGGMQTQKAFFAKAELVALKKHNEDLQADMAANEKLVEELSNDARKHGKTFQTVEDRSTGDACVVFDDESLRLLNNALGYPEVRPPGTKPVPGPRPAPAPG